MKSYVTFYWGDTGQQSVLHKVVSYILKGQKLSAKNLDNCNKVKFVITDMLYINTRRHINELIL